MTRPFGIVPCPQAEIPTPEMVAPWFDSTYDYWLIGKGARFSAEMQAETPEWVTRGEFEDRLIDGWDELDTELGNYYEATDDEDDFWWACMLAGW